MNMKHTKENWTLIISGAAILISFFGLCQSNKANSISSESNILSNRALNFQKTPLIRCITEIAYKM